MANWEKEFHPNIVIKKIEETKRQKSDGTISFSGWRYLDYRVLIRSMIEFDSTIPSFEQSRIITEAILNAGTKTTINKNSLLAEINRLETAYLNQIPNQYCLLTTISLKKGEKLPVTKIDNCTLTFNPKLSKKFYNQHTQILSKANKYFYTELPKDYSFVKITVKSKSTFDAADKALDAINLLRAIMNFYYNIDIWSGSSSGIRKPINKILLGPVHSLHKENGDLAAENWWYDTDYITPVKPHTIKNDIPDLIKFIRQFRTRLYKSNYSDELKKALRMYTQSLDLVNWEIAFLRLWGILEHLTKNSNEKYDRTIKRILFLSKDREYTEQVLKHLKDYRNISVHVDPTNDDIKIYLYQVKRYVEDLIFFHLNKDFKFESKEESAKFLELPFDIDEIDKKIAVLRKARKFQSL